MPHSPNLAELEAEIARRKLKPQPVAAAPAADPQAQARKDVIDLFDPKDEQAPSPAASPAAGVSHSLQDIEAEIARRKQTPAQVGGEEGFLPAMASSFRTGAKAAGDLASGNFFDQNTPKSGALADKLMEGFSGEPTLLNVLKYAFANTGKAAPGEIASALLEKFNANPAGKAVTAMGGLNPTWNLIGTAVNQYGVKPVAQATGIPEENIQLGLMAASPLGYKQAGKISDPAAATAVRGAKAGQQFYGNIRAGVRSRSTPELNADAASMLNSAGQEANMMRGGDATLTPQASQGITSRIQQLFAQPENEIFPDSHPVTNDIYQKLMQLGTAGPFRLNDLNNLRERLVNEGAGSDAGMAGKLRTAMMDSLSNLQPQDVASGNPASLVNLQQFLNKYKQGKRFEDVSSLINTANQAPNVADALQRVFGRFVADDSNHSNFTPDEIGLMQQVGQKGFGDALLKLVGSVGLGPNNKLIPVLAGMAMYGGGLGVIPTAITSMAAMAARSARNNAVRGRAENVLNAIEARNTSASMPPRPQGAQTVIPPTSVTPAAGPPVAGPNIAGLIGVRQPNTFVAGWNGNVRPQTPAEMFEAGAARDAAQSTGATPDVVRAWEANRATAAAPRFAGSEMGQRAAGDFYRPMGDWMGDPTGTQGVADPAAIMRDLSFGKAENAQAMEKAAQTENMWKENTPSVGDMITQGVTNNAERGAAAGTGIDLGPIGQAMLDALKTTTAEAPPQAAKRKPLKITISKDPEIGPDGLPRIDLPQMR